MSTDQYAARSSSVQWANWSLWYSSRICVSKRCSQAAHLKICTLQIKFFCEPRTGIWWQPAVRIMQPPWYKFEVCYSDKISFQAWKQEMCRSRWHFSFFCPHNQNWMVHGQFTCGIAFRPYSDKLPLVITSRSRSEFWVRAKVVGKFSATLMPKCLSSIFWYNSGYFKGFASRMII